jgi:hypothetical protein
VQLKSCHSKNFIIREQTKYRKIEILGLNPEVFGQILIDKYHERDIKNQLQLVVDNSRSDVDNSKSQVILRDQIGHEVGPNQSRSMTNLVTKYDQIPSQSCENIEEKSSLEFFRVYLESLRGKMGESFTLSGERDREAHRLKVLKQLEEMKTGRLAL